jgi:hypothetical protein
MKMKTLSIGLILWVSSIAACFAQDSLHVDRMMGSLHGVAISGNYAYVADIANGLLVIDITNPTAPTEVGFYDTPGEAYGVALSGDYAYVGDGSSGLRVIDISNPTAPVEVGFCETPGWAIGVTVAGDYAFVADYGSGMRVIDITNPAAPTEVGFYDTPSTVHGVAVSGNYAYVPDYWNGLWVINVTNPAMPTLAGSYDSPGRAYRVVVAGDYAYLADGPEGGLRVINITNPAAPTEAGFYNTPGWAVGVAVAGNYAYVADYEQGLRVIDISNPAVPLETGCYGANAVHGVAVAGNYAYVVDGGFQVIDITNPSSPFEVGSYTHPCNSCANPINVGPGLYDGYYYHYNNTANTCCATSPVACVYEDGCDLGSCRSSGPSVIYVLNLAYETTLDIEVGVVGGGDVQFMIFTDCANPAGSCVASQDAAYPLDDPEILTGLVLAPGTYYISTSYYGIDNCGDINISIVGDHILPVELLSFEAVPGDRRVSLHWTTASETDNDHFDIERDGAVMGREEATNSPMGNTYSWSESNLINGREYVYSLISVSISGEREVIGTAGATPTMNAATITEYSLHQNYPNPFNPETNITFDLVEAGEVTLTVYNSTGQTVATLVNGTMTSGRHSVTFDASTLPSGLYFYRLDAANFTSVKKMVLMK